jgi:hypothetical protein
VRRWGVVAALLCAGLLVPTGGAAAAQHKVPLFTIVFQGGGSATYDDHAVFMNPACSAAGFSTESDTALLRWKVTWKHVVLQRRNFDDDHGVSNFHSGVGGQLQSQNCDPTSGQLMPVESSACGSSDNAAGPVSLRVKYFNRGKVNALLPHKNSSSFLFQVSAVGKDKSQTTGPQDCATAFGGEAFADVGFFTNSLKIVNRASKKVTEASRRSGTPNPLDCGVPPSSIETDHCRSEVHFKATVTIVRER